MYTNRVRIDVTPGGRPQLVHVSQYDADSRVLEFELFADDAEFTLPSGATAEINGTKPDGNGFAYAASISENVVSVTVKEQMAAVAGRVPCKIVITSGGKKLLTEKFVLMVDRAALDIDTLDSKSEIRQLVEIEDRADEIIAAAAQVEAAIETLEGLSEDAEDAATAAEEARAQAAAAAQAAAEALAGISTKSDTIDAKIAALETEYEEDMEALGVAKTDALQQIEAKAGEVAQLKVNAEGIAASALSKANNLENEFAEVEQSAESLKQAVIEMQLLLSQKADNGYVNSRNYLQLTSNGDDIGDEIGPFASSGGGGGGGGASGGNNAVFSARNATGWITKTIASGDACEVKIDWSSLEEEISTGNGTVRVTVAGIVRASLEVPQGLVTVDVSGYLGTGTNLITLNISDIYGNNKTFNLTATVIEIGLTSSFDTTTPYEGPIQFPYTPTGAVAKTVYIELDGVMAAAVNTSVSGRQLTYTIQQQTHGAHRLRAWFECTINGQTVRSNELYFEFIAIEPLNSTPIITSNFNGTAASQYETINVDYTVYTPSSEMSEARLLVDDAEITTLTVDRQAQVWAVRLDETGEHTLKIVSGTAAKTFTLEVAETEIDVEPVTDQLALFLTSYGRSNAEAHPEVWKSGDIEAELTDFGFVRDGWVQDKDGVTVLRVTGDSRVSIPLKMFEGDPRQMGRTFEIECAIHEVRNYTTPVLSCMSGGRGFQMTSQKAAIQSEQTSVNMQYKEDEHFRLSFTIGKRSENRLLICYVNGIPSAAAQYPDDDDFSQVEPVNITIGTNDATIDIYNIRVYTTDLSDRQILDNRIADTQEIGEKLALYRRNQIFDEYGNIIGSKLPSDLPRLTFTCDELPQYKGDKKTVTVKYHDPLFPQLSFETTMTLDVQGTSSAVYYVKNFKGKAIAEFTLENGTTAAKYAIGNGIPVKQFCWKADVASSESANNVVLARHFNDATPYTTPAQEEDSRIRQTIDGMPIAVFWNDGNTTTFWGKYNFNYDKGTPEVYGYVTGDESIEFLNNTSDRVIFKSDDFSGDGYLSDFEWNFPDEDPPFTDATQLAELAAWVVSTDPDKATGEDLAQAVTYGGTEYTKDTESYRLAKFKAELGDYVEVDSAIFYYLFTLVYLMVDSRAKNAFLSFAGAEIAG